MVDIFKVEKEVMERYGLSKEDLLKITPYERYVEIFGEPKKLLGDEEPEWEYVISYPVEAVYADIADWNSMMAFRELLQNALDGAEEVGGNVNDVNVYDYNGFLVIENPSKKILYRHLKIGRSDKPCWSRGRYGEGLDVAACFFLTRGSSMYVISYDVAFRFILPENDITVLIGKPKKSCYGYTKVMVSGFGNMADKVGEVLFSGSVLASAIIGGYEMGVDCDYNAKVVIAEKKGEYGKLYVKDMLVNKFTVLTDRDSIFDYNLWWTPLSRDRIHVSSVGEMYCEISELFDKCDNKVKIADIIIDKLCSVKYTHNSKYYEFSGDTIEAQVISGMRFSSEFRKILTNRFLEKYNLKPDDTGVAGDASFVDKYSYLGYNVVVNSLPVRNFILNLDSVDDLIARDFEKFNKSTKEGSVWSVYKLEDDKFRNYIIGKYGLENLINTISAVNYSMCMIGLLSAGLNKNTVNIKLCDMSEMEGVKKGTIALYSKSDNCIYFGIDRMGYLWLYYLRPEDVGAEEAIHALSGAGDVEASFEKCLIKYLNMFYNELTNDFCRFLGFLIGRTGKVLCNIDRYYNGSKFVCNDLAVNLYSSVVGGESNVYLTVGHIRAQINLVITNGSGVIVNGFNDFANIILGSCKSYITNVVYYVKIKLGELNLIYMYFVFMDSEDIDKLCLIGDYKSALKKIANKIKEMEDEIKTEIKISSAFIKRVNISDIESMLDEAFNNGIVSVIGVDGYLVGDRLCALVE